VGKLNVCRILVGKTERSVVRPRHRLKNYIKIYLKSIGLEVWDGFIWLRIWTFGEFI
jgi:hypothetical protein